MTQFQFLEKGRILSWQQASELCVLTGELWLTVEGDLKDYVLNPGQTFTLPAELLVVIEALEPTNLVVSDSHLSLENSESAPHPRNSQEPCRIPRCRFPNTEKAAETSAKFQ